MKQPNDLVWRRDVIREFQKPEYSFGSSVFNVIRNVPTADIRTDRPKGEWIPVSERLPENNGHYLVTEKRGRVCSYVFRKEGNSEEYWRRCAVAWMSLPDPYKGGEQI